ncbi:Hypothetical predicted protein [Octopus vulgaris]|uniref:SUN domain-containing protein n=1 Tax=Octopus vulgaris TaxID=6645 RepID=A0AA36AH41_OCTVU|nr:Hypothetical predicted protein [Octopus vulgaris]
MGTKTQIVKFCFLLILCLTCTFWHSLTNASEPLTARTRQIEAKSDSSTGTEKKLPEHHTGHAAAATSENTRKQNEVSQNEPKDSENKHSETPEKEIEKKTEPESDQSKENLEHSKSEHSEKIPPVVVEVIPSKVSTEQASSESTMTVSSPESTADSTKQTEETEARYEELHPNVEEISIETAEKDPSFDDASVISDTTTQTDKIENKDSLEKGANDEETAEEFPSYSEWTKKVLAEEKNKQDDQGQTSSNLPQKQKMRNNYASADCGAKVVLANPEAENIKYILNSNPDEYMINPCQSKKWFIVELCESIQIKNIETASLELFSSRPKTFRISVSDRYPIKEWQLLGTFESTEERTIHKYQITEENYSKFVKVDILDHYGEEHFCPLTLFRVFGFTIEEDMESDVNQHDDLDDDVQDEPPVNLFASAKDTVLRLVKHVLTTGNEQANKENEDGSQAGHPEESKSNATSQKIKTPNATIPCQENCLNGTLKNATNTTSTNSTELPCVPQVRVNASTTTKAIEPSSASEQIQPSVPEGSVSQIPESSVQSPSEKLVTILNDDEQVPISDTASNEPMVKLIESEEQHHPAVLSSYITCCLTCPLKKTSTKYSSSRSLKCQFLKRVSAIATSSKKDSISWKVPLVSKIVEEPSAAHTSDTDLLTQSILHSADRKSDQDIVTLETETSSSHSTKPANLTVSEPTASLYPSSEVHTALKNEKTKLTDQKSSQSSVVAQVISKDEHSESESVSSLPKEEVNETSFVSDIPSTEPKTASSKMASSGGVPVDFRTPATTLYIEPSSTSVKQVELNGVTSEHYDSHLSPSDLLFSKSASTASLLDKQDVTLGIKSDDKAKLKETESNIITTASLPKSGEEMEPTGANIVPTRVSDSRSKAVVPESSSISISSMTPEDKVVKAVNITDPKVDSKGRPLYTLVRVGLPPAGKRESAIMRLNNRIKALELNVSLSSRFLDELSQRYRKQSEEMMHFLNKTVARLGNVTKKTQETVQKHEIHLTILESRLDNLTLAVSQLTENMDNLTRQLTDRQVLWASIEVFILALIFVVCLRKRQPSLPPNLVAKVLDDLLQTQHFSPNRRRNSESNVKQSSASHCEVVRQKSADDLIHSKAVHIVEPTTPFLLGQTKEGNKKRKKKKNRSVDLKMSSSSKEGLPKEKSVSTTQLNSAGLLFMGQPVESSSSPARDVIHYKQIRERVEGESGTSVGSVCSSNSSSSNNNTGAYSIARVKECSHDANIRISCSKSDPDLYTSENSATALCCSTHLSNHSTPLPSTQTSFSLPSSTSKVPLMCSIPKSFSSSLPASVPATPSAEQCQIFNSTNSLLRTNLITYPIKQSSSLSDPIVAGSTGLVKTVTGTHSTTFRNKYRSLDVGQKNSSERKNVNRCRTQVPCDGFRKF